MSPDTINGLFEAFGAAMLTLNVRQIWRDRRVAGIHWAATAFYAGWGGWNLYYYPHLGQWFSFACGCAVLAANVAWLASLLILTRREAQP